MRKEKITTAIKEVTFAEEVTCSCDVCGKKIFTRKYEEKATLDNGSRIYWHLTTGHHDWGPDSVDSIEDFDICSAECAAQKFEEYMTGSSETERNSMYFELRRERVC